MATHDYNLANQDGASFRSDLNNALAAIVSNNSSATAPATTFAHQIWQDITADVVKQRNAANNGWVELWREDGGFNAKTFSGDITLNSQSDLRFADSNSSNWVAFQAPATVPSNVTWTLPSADGTSGQSLTTNGSGTLSWASAGGDNITEGNTSAEVVDTGSDGHFKVVTEGTEALRINNSQRVGIGDTAFDALLSIKGAADLNTTPHIRLKDGTDAREAWIANNAGDLQLANGGNDNVPHCFVKLVDDNQLQLGTSNTERFRIGSLGQLGIGGATYGTSGQVLTSQGSSSAPQWATPAGGKVLQVVSTQKTSVFTTSSTTYVTITGLTATITPSSTSSKILVTYSLACGGRNSDNSGTFIRLYRGSAVPHIGDTSGSRERATMAINNQGANVDFYTGHYLDSPNTTSAITYEMKIRKRDGVTVYINQENGQNDADNIYYGRYPSTITLMEIGA